MPFVSNGGVRIHWEEQGEGEPLLMIMGLSFSMVMWGALRHVLARRFRTILLDNRCVGKSDSPVPPFTVADMARDALCVLDATRVESANVFGMSMGGMIAQTIAIQNPARVKKLVLGCTHCDGAQAVWAHSQFLQLLRFPLMSREARIKALVPYIYHPSTPYERIERDLVLLRTSFPSLASSSKQMAAVARWRSCENLMRIKSPTLVVHGEADRLIHASKGRFISQHIPRSQFLLIPQAGHIFATDQPDITQKGLLNFLSDF